MGSIDPSTYVGDDAKKWREASKTVNKNLTKLKNDANAKALKIGENPKYTDVITALEIEKNPLSADFLTNYLTRMYEAGAKVGLDPYTVDLYINGKKGNTGESVYYQIDKLGKDRAAYIAKKEAEKANK
jgi:hypothetical protein